MTLNDLLWKLVHILMEVKHGKHRKPSPPVRSNPTRQPSHSSAAGAARATVTVHAVSAAGAYGAHTVEDAGIRPGEVIAQRYWWMEGDRLFSIYMEAYEWFPDRPAHGDVDAGWGIHAYKTTKSAMREYGSLTNYAERTLVAGTVALWGEIIEHEEGYRAEYGKVVALHTNNEEILQRFGIGRQEDYKMWRKRLAKERNNNAL